MIKDQDHRFEAAAIRIKIISRGQENEVFESHLRLQKVPVLMIVSDDPARSRST
jgi:hypothetical protein